MQDPHILVVDEEELFHKSLKLAFRQNHYHATIVNNYEEAIKQLEEHKFEAILLDLKMPTEEALVYIEKITQTNKDTRVVLISSHHKPDFLVRIFRAGVFAFIRKPESFSKMLDHICLAVEFKKKDALEIVSATPEWLEVNMPAHKGYVLALSSFMGGFMRELTGKDRQLVLYALQELMQNAIEHGCRNQIEQKITFAYVRAKRFLLFRIHDVGDGFDFNSLPHAALGSRPPIEVANYRKQSGMRPGGLGISCALSIADELIYNQKGNAVIMIKYLPDA